MGMQIASRDLAGAAPRQLVEHDDFAGDFVVGQVVANVLLEIVDAC
jgi:hypothetical protein